MYFVCIFVYIYICVRVFVCMCVCVCVCVYANHSYLQPPSPSQHYIRQATEHEQTQAPLIFRSKFLC